MEDYLKKRKKKKPYKENGRLIKKKGRQPK
jgi:hypothetical protein